MDHWRGRSTAVRVAILGLLASSLTALGVVSSLTSSAQAAASCPADGCAVTIDAHDFTSGAALTNFTYVINKDNSRYIDPLTGPADPFPQYTTTESNSPIVRVGDQDRDTVTLPPGRYLISVRSLDHKMWGKHITLPDDAAADGTLTTRIDLTT
jgi:hypothetical protein